MPCYLPKSRVMIVFRQLRKIPMRAAWLYPPGNEVLFNMSNAKIIYIADVYCPWCYGFGPLMHRLSQEHPEFPVTVYGGNLMSQPVDLANLAVMEPGEEKFWTEVEKTTGRSLQGAIDALENRKHMRLYSPGADAILIALKELAPGNELEQVLMLEDIFYGQGMDLFGDEALEQMARRWNVSAQAIADKTNAPEMQRKVEENLATAAALMGEIGAYPSIFLVRGNRRDAVSRGFVRYATVDQRMQDAMQDLALEDINPQGSCTWHDNCNFSRKRKG